MQRTMIGMPFAGVRWGVIFSALVGALGAREAVAGPITPTFLLNESNTFPGSTVYGKVTVTADATAGTVDIKATVNPNVVPGPLSNFGLQSFGFNSAIALTAS